MATRLDRSFAGLLFVFALIPRLVLALAWAMEPIWDGIYYAYGGRRIAAGLGEEIEEATALLAACALAVFSFRQREI